MTVEDWIRPRRRDRTMVDETEIEALLHRAQVGFTATARDGQPFQHSSLFCYDASHRRIYFHGALQGRIHDNVLANPRVCFTVAELGRLLPGETAMEFSNEYASVVAFGQARLVQEDDEKRRALQALLDKYFPDKRPGRDYRPITDQELAATNVYAIEVDGWSGKQKVVQP